MGSSIESVSGIYHPLKHGFRISSIDVLKVFLSNARPLLAQTNHIDPTQNFPPVILKHGDDMRQDMACLITFEMMNLLWKNNQLEYQGVYVESFVYPCMALSSTIGVIQPVEDCMALSPTRKIVSG